MLVWSKPVCLKYLSVLRSARTGSYSANIGGYFAARKAAAAWWWPPSSSVEVKKEGNCSSTPIHVVHRRKFTCYLKRFSNSHSTVLDSSLDWIFMVATKVVRNNCYLDGYPINYDTVPSHGWLAKFRWKHFKTHNFSGQ